MRNENAIFGGEMSAHYYFRDYFFCDCGMIPFVMMLEFLSMQEKTLSEIMHEMFWKTYFVSGEINTKVEDVQKVIQNAREKYISMATFVDDQDGISIDVTSKENPLSNWRFNVRGSNTEPVVRLNVEAKTQQLMEQKRDELLEMIK
jgi:phosphomannomutase